MHDGGMTKKPKRLVVGASEVAALFDAHPYVTKYELWLTKAGVIPKKPFAESEESFWGLMYERSTAEGYCQLHNRRLVTVPDTFYTAHDMPEMVANIDFLTAPLDDGAEADAVLECKMVDYVKFKDTFPAGELPLRFELQVQQEMYCTGMSKAVCAVVVNGNTLRPYERTLNHDVIAMLKDAISDFVRSVREDSPPPPDYTRDAGAIGRRYNIDDGGVLDARGNNYLRNLVIDYDDAALVESDIKRKRKALRAEILHYIGNAKEAHLDDCTITAGTVDPAEIAYTRQPYRNLNIRRNKQ